MKLSFKLIILLFYFSCNAQTQKSENKFETEIINLNESTYKGVSLFTNKKVVFDTFGKPDDVRIGKIQETDLNNQTKLYSYDIFLYMNSDGLSYSSYNDSAILSHISFNSDGDELIFNGKTLDHLTTLNDIKEYFPKAYQFKRNQSFDNSVTLSFTDNHSKKSIFKMNRIVLTFKENKLVTYSYHLASIEDLKP